MQPMQSPTVAPTAQPTFARVSGITLKSGERFVDTSVLKEAFAYFGSVRAKKSIFKRLIMSLGISFTQDGNYSRQNSAGESFQLHSSGQPNTQLGRK